MMLRAPLVILLLLSITAAGARAAAGAAYDLTPKPQVGRLLAYDASLDQQLAVESSNAANVHSTRSSRFHAQVVVKSDEITAAKDGSVTGKQIVFDRNSWTSNQENNDPPRKVRLVYADKTVNFHLTDEGRIDQDYGVKAGRDQMRLLFDIMERQTLLPRRAASVGERWACDDFLRAALDLKKNDVSSTIATFKAVREYAGRQCAEITVSGAAIRAGADEGSFNEEQSLEGTYLYDLETGVQLKCDVTGKSTVAGRPEDGPAVNVSGTGSFEMHYAARFPPPRSPVAAAAVAPREIASTQPVVETSTNKSVVETPTTKPVAQVTETKTVQETWNRSGTSRRR